MLTEILSEIVSSVRSHRRQGVTSALTATVRSTPHSVFVVANDPEAIRVRREFGVEARQIVSLFEMRKLTLRKSDSSLILFDSHAVAEVCGAAAEEIGRLQGHLKSLVHDAESWKQKAMDNEKGKLHQERRDLRTENEALKKECAEWKSVAEKDERVGIGVYRRLAHARMDRIDILEAEIDRLQGLLKEGASTLQAREEEILKNHQDWRSLRSENSSLRGLLRSCLDWFDSVAADGSPATDVRKALGGTHE